MRTLTVTEARGCARKAHTIFVRVQLHAGKGAPKSWIKASKRDVLLMLQGHAGTDRVHGMVDMTGKTLYLGRY